MFKNHKEEKVCSQYRTVFTNTVCLRDEKSHVDVDPCSSNPRKLKDQGYSVFITGPGTDPLKPL